MRGLLNALRHVLLGEVLLEHPLLLMLMLLMLQVHDGFVSILWTHPSELRKLCGRKSMHLLTNGRGKRPRVHTVDRGSRFLKNLTSVHLGYVGHLLQLPTVREHLVRVDAMVHESCLNCLTGSHHRAMGHRVCSNARVHKLAGSVEHRWVRRVLNSIIRKLGGR